MPTQAEKCREFAALHSQPRAFIMPNPWDAGSARLLQGMGFKALATTSSGFAFAIGKVDGEPTLEEKLAHCEALAEATDIPLSVDFENGFATDPEAVAGNILTLVETGVAGCSIEDFDRDDQSLYEMPLAVERVAAAVEAARTLDFPFTLTARAEHLIRGGSDLDEVIERLQAFSAAGADVLFAPGIGTLADLKTVTQAIDKPFNVLGVMVPGASLADLEAAGAQRVSIGGALAFAAAKPIIDFGEAMANDGAFTWTAQMAPPQKIMALLQNS
jgi:2-methylisocitrate lyase-like PEP mutase family enzyme